MCALGSCYVIGHRSMLPSILRLYHLRGVRMISSASATQPWKISVNDLQEFIKVYITTITTKHSKPMMTSSNGDIVRVTDPLQGEFTGHRWIPLTKTSGAELWCFPWSTNDWVNNRDAGDLRRHGGHYDATVMPCAGFLFDITYMDILFHNNDLNCGISIFGSYGNSTLSETCFQATFTDVNVRHWPQLVKTARWNTWYIWSTPEPSRKTNAYIFPCKWTNCTVILFWSIFRVNSHWYSKQPNDFFARTPTDMPAAYSLPWLKHFPRYKLVWWHLGDVIFKCAISKHK